MLKLAIMISGRGSNMLRLAEAINEMSLGVKITMVVANRVCDGITSAAECGLPVTVIKRQDFPDRASHECAVAETIEDSGADYIFLAGYMSVLSANFVDNFAGRLINIHPSLLPKYKGLDTHQRAIDDQADQHGVSVHLVTADLDAGPIIAQASLTILPGDTASSLAARVLHLEHQIYPFVLASLCNKTLEITEKLVIWQDLPAAVASLPKAIRDILQPALVFPR